MTAENLNRIFIVDFSKKKKKKLPLLIRTPINGLGPILLHSDLILTWLHLQKIQFSNKVT